METTEYVRRPFVVEAVQITPENIEEIASEIGVVKTKDDGTPFIMVDRRVKTTFFRVYLGYWVTRKDGTIRCYSDKIFANHFTPMEEDIRHWVDFMSSDNENHS